MPSEKIIVTRAENINMLAPVTLGTDANQQPLTYFPTATDLLRSRTGTHGLHFRSRYKDSEGFCESQGLMVMATSQLVILSDG
jgi:hypothetical protein